MATQLMQRTGEVPSVETQPEREASEPKDPEPSPTLDQIMFERRDERAQGELMVLDRLLRSAEQAGDFKACISLLEEARKLWTRHGARDPE